MYMFYSFMYLFAHIDIYTYMYVVFGAQGFHVVLGQKAF